MLSFCYPGIDRLLQIFIRGKNSQGIFIPFDLTSVQVLYAVLSFYKTPEFFLKVFDMSHEQSKAFFHCFAPHLEGVGHISQIRVCELLLGYRCQELLRMFFESLLIFCRQHDNCWILKRDRN